MKTPVVVDRISNLDVLRAIAALAVCFYHFRRESMFGGSVYQSLAGYGNHGVVFRLRGGIHVYGRLLVDGR